MGLNLCAMICVINCNMWLWWSLVLELDRDGEMVPWCALIAKISTQCNGVYVIVRRWTLVHAQRVLAMAKKNSHGVLQTGGEVMMENGDQNHSSIHAQGTMADNGHYWWWSSIVEGGDEWQWWNADSD